MLNLFKVLGFVSLFSLTACMPSSNSTSKQDPHDVSTLTKTVNDPALTCAKETCGAASNLPYFTAPAQEGDINLFKTYVENPLIQFIELEVQAFNLQNKIVQNAEEMQISHVSDDTMAMVNFLYFSQFDKAVSDSLTTESSAAKVDLNKLKKELQAKGITDVNEVNWFFTFAKAIYESPTFNEDFYSDLFPLEIVIQIKYPGADPLTAISAEAKKLFAIQERLVKTFPAFKNAMSKSSGILQKAIQKQPLDPEERKRFVEERTTLTMLNEMLPGGKFRKILLERKVNVKKMADQFVQKAKASPRLKIQGPKFNSERQSAQAQCNYNLQSSLASSPTRAQNLSFAEMMKNVKNEAKTVIGRTAYNSSLEIQSAIEKVGLLLPADKQQTAASLSRLLNGEVNAAREIIQTISKLNMANQTDKEVVLLLLANEFANEEEEDANYALVGVKDFCRDNAPPYVSDVSYTGFNLINVGWLSVMYPQYGYGIVAHELGHAISGADMGSSNPKFNNAKACLKENQSGKDLFVEEDFADLFAMQMMNLKSRASSNYACLLLYQVNNEYASLNMVPYEGDTHASSFYRLISIGSQIQNLSPTCKQVKDASPEGHKMKNCWGL